MSAALGPMTVAELLQSAGDLPRWALACTPPLLPLSSDDPCLIIDSRDLSEDEDVPAEAAAMGLTRALGRRTVLDVLDNLLLQRPSAGLAESLEALNHYLLTDAFVDLRPDDARNEP